MKDLNILVVSRYSYYFKVISADLLDNHIHIVDPQIEIINRANEGTLKKTDIVLIDLFWSPDRSVLLPQLAIIREYKHIKTVALTFDSTPYFKEEIWYLKFEGCFSIRPFKIKRVIEYIETIAKGDTENSF